MKIAVILFIVFFIILMYAILYMYKIYMIKKEVVLINDLKDKFIIFTDKDFNIKFANEKFIRLFLNNNKNVNFFNLLTTDYFENKSIKVKNILKDEKHKCVKIKYKDGICKYFKIDIFKVRGFFIKNFNYIISIEDVDDLIYIYEKLEEYEDNKTVNINYDYNSSYFNNTQSSIKNLPLGFWEYDLQNKKFKHSEKLFNIANNIDSIYNFFTDSDYYSFLYKIIGDIIFVDNNKDFKYISKLKSKDKLIFLDMEGNFLEDTMGNINAKLSCSLNVINQNENDENVNLKYDTLTNLPNRTQFLKYLEEELKKEIKSAIVIISINDLNIINEVYGYKLGNKVLLDVVNKIKIVFKDYHISRFSGSKFAIFIPNYNLINLDDYLKEVFSQIIINYKDSNNKHKVLGVSLNGGISIYPDNSKVIFYLLRYAYIAISFAKEVGKNQYLYFNYSMKEKIEKSLYLEDELVKALKTKEDFSIYLQPKYSFSNGKLHGFEALIRWDNNKYGRVGPDEFIPIAERKGYIIDLGIWVLEQACLMIKEIQDLGYTNFSISVNISAEQLKDKNIISNIKTILLKTGIDTKHLQLEITESMLMENIDNLNYYDLLISLRELGIGISLDDFGKGYSSLSSLKDLPISEIKIDKNFVDNLSSSEIDRSIIREIIILSKILGLSTVAEGIETQDQYDFLESINCNYAQGYLCGKPMPKNEAFKLLKLLENK